ncbi:LOW QUALITY PROTEIN: hypothetical protein QC762_0065170 [Podospora pseudocomata]|uniref:Uncharacterized protein n=1 Tax=Podospora pseudocomata TaxID=2093779 RepID=A0ABR0GF91_9PEZI|nr:LOW QUALITY PROTEIN: hypothetical protein QC762_0065170 [Podospora pseudocomata]
MNLGGRKPMVALWHLVVIAVCVSWQATKRELGVCSSSSTKLAILQFCFSAFALVASAYALTPPVKPYFWQPSSAIVLPALNLTGNISPFTGNNASFNAPWYTLNQAGHSVRITGGSLISLADANITMPLLSATKYTQWIEFAVTSDGIVECPHSTFRAGVAITQNLTSNTAPQYYTFYTTQIGGQLYTRSSRFSPATKLIIANSSKSGRVELYNGTTKAFWNQDVNDIIYLRCA